MSDTYILNLLDRDANNAGIIFLQFYLIYKFSSNFTEESDLIFMQIF